MINFNSVGVGFWLGFPALAELWPFDFPILFPIAFGLALGLGVYGLGRGLCRGLGIPTLAPSAEDRSG